MTKKKQKNESELEQIERFKEAARRLEAAGELNPTEADNRLDQILKRHRKR
jgi:hypothetical protein